MTLLKLVHSVPTPVVDRIRQQLRQDNLKSYVLALEQRVVDMAMLMEEGENARAEQTEQLSALEKALEESTNQNAELKERIEELERDLCAEEQCSIDDLHEARVAFLLRSKNVAEHVHRLLGFESVDETLPRYELRRALEDLLETFDD